MCKAIQPFSETYENSILMGDCNALKFFEINELKCLINELFKTL